MLTTDLIKWSLEQQRECPKCGANWVNLDYDDIELITVFCPVCKMRFPIAGEKEDDLSQVQRKLYAK